MFMKTRETFAKIARKVSGTSGSHWTKPKNFLLFMSSKCCSAASECRWRKLLKIRSWQFYLSCTVSTMHTPTFQWQWRLFLVSSFVSLHRVLSFYYHIEEPLQRETVELLDRDKVGKGSPLLRIQCCSENKNHQHWGSQFSCAPVVKKFPVLQPGIVCWKQGNTIFSKVRVLFFQSVNLLVSGSKNSTSRKTRVWVDPSSSGRDFQRKVSSTTALRAKTIKRSPTTSSWFFSAISLSESVRG